MSSLSFIPSNLWIYLSYTSSPFCFISIFNSDLFFCFSSYAMCVFRSVAYNSHVGSYILFMGPYNIARIN